VESYPYERGDVEHLLKKADVFELSAEARVRLECLLHYVTHGRNASVTARRFGISRATFYNWLKKADLQDTASLENRSKAPKHVPQPETDERTIALIRGYRTHEPLLSKEKISERLRAEHGIALSASTVGRVIGRHGFYFADTSAHRAKRDSATDQREWGRQAAAIILAATGAGLLARPEPASALEGSTYQLQPILDAAGGTLDGSSFIINGGTLSDLSQVTEGAVFQITPQGITPSSSSSSTSESSSSSSSTTTEGGQTTGGGRRTIPAASSSSTAAEASSAGSSPLLPAAPQQLESGESIDALPHLNLGAHVAIPAAKPPAEKRIRVEPGPSSTQQQSSLAQGAATPPVHPPLSATPVTAYWTTSLLLLALACVISRSWWLAADTRNASNTRTYAHPGTIRFLRKTLFIILFGIALFLALLSNIAPANAATTVPQNRWYQGHLLNSDGSAVSTAVTIRFSEWKSADFTASDLTATGSINAAAANYVNWEEEHTVTPGTDGSFAVELGSITALPDLTTLPPATLQSLYLQVEVKVSGAADSTYDLLDSNTSDTAVDRTSILSLPFARNAEFLDQRDTGTGSGSIPVLTTGGSLSLSGSLTINDSNAAHDAVLTFGNDALAETLKFNDVTERFELSDDLGIMGDLEATGTMSGKSLQVTGTGAAPLIYTDQTTGNVGIGTTSPSAKLSVQNDGQARINLYTPGAGQPDIDFGLSSNTFYIGANARGGNGAYMDFRPKGDNTTALSIGQDRSVSIGHAYVHPEGNADGLTVVGNVGIGTAAPETKLEVSGMLSGASLFAQGNLAASGALKVNGPVTFGSTITIGNVTYTFPASDASGSGKVLMSDGAGHLTWGSVGSGNLALRTRMIAVSMNDVTVEADGTDNGANLFTGSDAGANHHQYYTVKTGSGQMQDLTLKVKVKLPSDFVDFGAANDIRFSYKTTGSTSADSTVDLLIEDNDGDDAFTAADGQGLFNTSWTDYTDECDGGSFDPAADEFVFITVKAYTTSGNQPYVGEIVLTYRAR
jgi:transposase